MTKTVQKPRKTAPKYPLLREVNSTAGSAKSTASYLILQGIASPFFTRLAEKLARTGAAVHRVNYCGGDWWFTGKTTAHISHSRFNHKADNPGALREPYLTLVKKHAVTDIILFGDCRPIHSDIRALAQEKGLKLWVFEEGYIRPGFITCEEGGTNDFSSMPRSLKAIIARAKILNEQNILNSAEIAEIPQSMGQESTSPSNRAAPLPDVTPTDVTPASITAPIATSLFLRVRMDIAHHFWSLLLHPIYHRYRSHRPHSRAEEIGGWYQRLRRRSQHKAANTAVIATYQQQGPKIFLVPLQLNSDFQVRLHSPYDGVLDFVREVITSFAAHAPSGARLLFKSHPLDNGMIDYRSYIAMAALKYAPTPGDISANTASNPGRRPTAQVDFVEGGDLEQYLDQSQGVVLINSTVGYAALNHLKPVKVLGRAIYDMDGLTDQNPLDAFWRAPTTPEASAVAAFLQVIKADTQIPGDFYAPAGLSRAVEHAAKRLTGAQN